MSYTGLTPGRALSEGVSKGIDTWMTGRRMSLMEKDSKRDDEKAEREKEQFERQKKSQEDYDTAHKLLKNDPNAEMPDNLNAHSIVLAKEDIYKLGKQDFELGAKKGAAELLNFRKTYGLAPDLATKGAVAAEAYNRGIPDGREIEARINEQTGELEIVNKKTGNPVGYFSNVDQLDKFANDAMMDVEMWGRSAAVREAEASRKRIAEHQAGLDVKTAKEKQEIEEPATMRFMKARGAEDERLEGVKHGHRLKEIDAAGSFKQLSDRAKAGDKSAKEEIETITKQIELMAMPFIEKGREVFDPDTKLTTTEGQNAYRTAFGFIEKMNEKSGAMSLLEKNRYRLAVQFVEAFNEASGKAASGIVGNKEESRQGTPSRKLERPQKNGEGQTAKIDWREFIR